MINKVLPRTISEVQTTDKVFWSENGSDYDKVRHELLKLL